MTTLRNDHLPAGMRSEHKTSVFSYSVNYRGLAGLSRPGWLVLRWDGLPAPKWLLIEVIARPMCSAYLLIVTSVLPLSQTAPVHCSW